MQFSVIYISIITRFDQIQFQLQHANHLKLIETMGNEATHAHHLCLSLSKYRLQGSPPLPKERWNAKIYIPCFPVLRILRIRVTSDLYECWHPSSCIVLSLFPVLWLAVVDLIWDLHLMKTVSQFWDGGRNRDWCALSCNRLGEYYFGVANIRSCNGTIYTSSLIYLQAAGLFL